MEITREKIPAMCSLIVGDAVIVFGMIYAFRYLPIPILRLRASPIYSFIIVAALLFIPIAQWAASTVAFAVGFLISEKGELFSPFYFRDAFFYTYNKGGNLLQKIVWIAGVFALAVAAGTESCEISTVWAMAITSLISLVVVDCVVLGNLTIADAELCK